MRDSPLASISNNKGTITTRRGGSTSFGTTTGTNSTDRPVAHSLVGLVALYIFVTAVAFCKLSGPEDAGSLSLLSSTSTSVADAVAGEVQFDPIWDIQHTFPVHTTENEDDTEFIDHPGLATIVDPSQIPKGLPVQMKVPKFFDETAAAVAAYKGSIRTYLGAGNRLMTTEEAASIGSYDSEGRETIYCSIASYRDPECNPTVIDLFDRAAHPERIRVAILDQRADGDLKCGRPERSCNDDPEQTLCKYRHLIDVYEMDARLGVGPVFARHLAHRHYRGEYFAMQVDSHVRFIASWDDIAVQYWKEAHNEMAVLTTYLSDVIGRIDPVTHKATHDSRPIMCASDWEGFAVSKHLRHGQQPEAKAGIRGQPTIEPFWAAGFSFARGHFVIQVPYDQYLPMVFQGEEISIGLRGFTYGYDYYAPEQNICYHMYAVKENAAKRHAVPLFWEHKRLYKQSGQAAMKRLNAIIGMGYYPDNDWPQQEQDKYGLGHIRTTDKFFRTYGIHVDTQTIEHHLCRFVGKPMMRVLMPALREDRMGIDYAKINYEFKDPAPDAKPRKARRGRGAV